jgi:hypothetical protein
MNNPYEWYKHPLKNIRWKLGSIKGFFQRGIRGYSDRDLWSLDYHLMNILVEGLDQFRKESHSYPRSLTPEAWDEILLEMIEGFNIGKDLVNLEWESEEDMNQKQAKLDRALDLLKTYFLELWD